MLFTKNRPKTHQKQTQVSTEEAFRLWEKARVIYTLINHFNFTINFSHDIDFQLVLKNLINTLLSQVNLLEKQLNKYSIKSPQPSKRDIEAIGNMEVSEDRNIARVVFSLLQLLVSKSFLAVKDSLFNDNLREMFYRLTKEDINMYDEYLDYIVIKGWMEEPPLYKSLKNAEKRIATNEIWHLWKILDNRYLSKQQTKYYASSVIDKDFEILLNRGVNLLEKQVNQLEEKLLYFGVNLPEKFSKNIPTPESKERITDEFIFQVLFMSMTNAVTLEGFAVEELIVNSDIRKMFKGFLFEEFDLINDIIKYGKVKGWVQLQPQFRSR